MRTKEAAKFEQEVAGVSREGILKGHGTGLAWSKGQETSDCSQRGVWWIRQKAVLSMPPRNCAGKGRRRRDPSQEQQEAFFVWGTRESGVPMIWSLKPYV